MRRLTVLLAAAVGLSSCGYVSFERAKTPDEVRLEQSVRGYYGDVRRAFAVGNADALTSLFSPSITHPMTQAQIRAWADKFFAEHGRARMRVEKLDVDELSFVRAVVTLSYRVETTDGKGSFGGAERDVLERRDGRWFIASWDKE
jgi:hypothetical protein